MIQHALALISDNAYARYNLAKELMKRGDKAKALEHFQRAAELGSTAARESVQSLHKGKYNHSIYSWRNSTADNVIQTY